MLCLLLNRKAEDPEGTPRNPSGASPRRRADETRRSESAARGLPPTHSKDGSSRSRRNRSGPLPDQTAVSRIAPPGSLARARWSFRPVFRSDRQSKIGNQFSGGLIRSQ